MVTSSLSLASVYGLVLIAWALVSVPAGGFQTWFLLNRRADVSSQVLASTFRRLMVCMGRLVGLPLAGGILFFQGWRMDPVLQFAVFLLAAGVIAESFNTIIEDYKGWRQRRN
jgi:CHASE2 domain-containing sensor protein